MNTGTLCLIRNQNEARVASSICTVILNLKSRKQPAKKQPILPTEKRFDHGSQRLKLIEKDLTSIFRSSCLDLNRFYRLYLGGTLLSLMQHAGLICR